MMNLRKMLCCSTLPLILLCSVAVAKEPTSAPAIRAFPGAEGFGAYTPGGRGGKVFVVTTLEDYGKGQPVITGSLREAVAAEGPRIIVFAVSGTIHLKRGLRAENPFLTIAGQTAPGEGICIADNGVSISGTHDIILRHLRVRRGDTDPNGGDAVWFRNCRNVIVDHCSISWAQDENFSFTKSTTDVTAQWCIISEALNPNHHGYGSLIAPDVDSRMSFHHNLYASNFGRIPRAGSRGEIQFIFDWRNNVAYNWGCGYDWGAWAGYSRGEIIDTNFVGNYSIAGPDTSVEVTLEKGIHPRFETNTEGFRGAALGSHSELSRIFQNGNKIDSNVNGKLDGVDNGWGMILGKYKKAEKEFAIPAEFAVTTDNVDQAYERVLATAGALPSRRDAVDTRVVESVRKQTGRIINSPSEVGGYPPLKAAPAPADSDSDGMPDAWEKAHGLNPDDTSDAAKPAKDGGGYTNIEQYINELAK